MRSRAWRRNQKEKIIERRLKLLRQFDWVFYVPIFFSRESYYDDNVKRRNFLGKTHSLGCRKKQCWTCHHGKYHPKARRDAIRKAIDFEVKSVA